MSAKIYFNKGKTQVLQRALIAFLSNAHRMIAPKHAFKTAQRVLLSPSRIQSRYDRPDGLIEHTISTSEGDIATYRLGSGPIWLLIHGWSGAAHQYYPLMQHIVAKGYQVIAYDQPAHGQSGGTRTHLPGFVKALAAVLDDLQSPIAGVVAHSMGSAALAEAQDPRLVSLPQLLIAPVLNYVENMYESVERSGYSRALFNKVVAQVAEQYQSPIHSVDPIAKFNLQSNNMTIVHDPNDRLARFSASQSLVESRANISLTPALDMGHGRIMSSHFVMQGFDGLVDQVQSELRA